MKSPRSVLPRVGRSPLLSLLLLGAVSAQPVLGAQGDLIGVRLGGSAGSDGGEFSTVEVAFRRELPWQWSLGDHWRLRSQLEAGLTVLEGRGETGVVASLGPVGVFEREDSRWTFELGVKPALLSEHRFGTKDLGGTVQFASHLGLNYRFREDLSVGYRYQHLSNAGLYDPNPGLDLHLITFDWLLD